MVIGHLLLSELSLKIEEHSLECTPIIQYSNGNISYDLEFLNAYTIATFEDYFRDDGLFLLEGKVL